MSVASDFDHYSEYLSTLDIDWYNPFEAVIGSASAMSEGIQSVLGVDDPAKESPELLLELTKLALDYSKYLAPPAKS